MIDCKNLEKEFKSYKKDPGFKGSLKSLFRRKYIKNLAVYDFSMTIKKGEIIALLGPNGSGKTTLIKMLTGIIVPSSGEVQVCGHIPEKREKDFRKKIALVMGQKSQLWWDIPAMDSFRLLQKYYEIEPQKFNRRMEELTQYLQVKEILNTHVRKLSLGERMKLELIASLLHEPEILFLDEPTIGLDLMAQENIREFIRQYHREHQCTILLTSHYMADIDALCNRLIFMFNGEKYFDGKLSQFSNILERKVVVSFEFESPQNTENKFWQSFDPVWNEQGTQVKLHLKASNLRTASQKILNDYPVNNFFTEKAAIEMVVKEIIKNPEILNAQ